MKYNDFDLVANPNGYGYVQDENECYYYDALATQAVPQGKKSYNVGGLSAWYLSTGERATSQHTGEVKASFRVVDGVVDNGVDYENWNGTYADFTTTADGVEITATASNGDIVLSNVKATASTEYLLVFDITKNDITTLVRLAGSINSIFFGQTATLFGMVTGEQRIVLTSNASLTATPTFECKPNTAFTGELDYTFAMYPTAQFTNPLTDPLPTSQQPVDGNSLIQQMTKHSVFEADKLKTANNWYSALGVPQLVAIADLANVQDFVEFINKSPWEQLLYSREITNTSSTAQPTELDKVGLYTELYEKVYDSEGVLVVDSNGKVVTAPKITTTLG